MAKLRDCLPPPAAPQVRVSCCCPVPACCYKVSHTSHLASLQSHEAIPCFMCMTSIQTLHIVVRPLHKSLTTCGCAAHRHNFLQERRQEADVTVAAAAAAAAGPSTATWDADGGSAESEAMDTHSTSAVEGGCGSKQTG
jgi:hypothetical protein